MVTFAGALDRLAVLVAAVPGRHGHRGGGTGREHGLARAPARELVREAEEPPE
jgi:hypothetical protein